MKVVRRTGVAVALAVAACGRGDGGEASAATGRVWRPAMRLVEHGGRPFDLAEQRGRVVVVFFGYATCPDICPTTMADFASVKRRLGSGADRVRFVFVTVDPARDTPQAAQAYAHKFDSTFIGLSGDSSVLAAAQQQFLATSWIDHDSTGAALVAHTGSVFVVGKDGQVRVQLPYNETPSEALYAAIVEALAR